MRAFLVLLAASVQAQSPDSPVIRVTSNEVLVDVVVRDKKGHFLHKLEKDDFVVTEDGKPQEITAFREISGIEASRIEAAAAGSSPSAPANAPRTPDASRQIRLVSLVFDRLSVDSRKLARQGAIELIRSDAGPNVYYGVFFINNRLRVIQTFTNDHTKLKSAVERATSLSEADFANDNNSLRLAQSETGGSDGAAAATAAAAGASRGAAPVDGAAMANEQMNRVVSDMLDLSDMLSREQASGSTIFSLLAMVKEQGRLPGRKALVYFSEGLQVPNSLWTPFATLISTANKANVSIYSVDARGLTVASDTSVASAMARSAAGASYSQWARSVETTPVTRRDVMIFDSAMDSLRADKQAVISELAESTGGLLIANTNDLRVPLRRVNEEIRSYYEISYKPANQEIDGRFHEIGVKVNRAAAQVMSRSGYFALPSLEGQVVYPYEVPLLNAVKASPLPRGLDYRVAVVPFESREAGRNASLIFDLPLKDVTFAKLEEQKSYRTHISVMALVKDGKGRVVAKLSRDLPVREPLDKLEGFQQGRLIVTRSLQLAPGRYTVESAVADREGNRVSAKRSAFVIAAATRRDRDERDHADPPLRKSSRNTGVGRRLCSGGIEDYPHLERHGSRRQGSGPVAILRRLSGADQHRCPEAADRIPQGRKADHARRS